MASVAASADCTPGSVPPEAASRPRRGRAGAGAARSGPGAGGEQQPVPAGSARTAGPLLRVQVDDQIAHRGLQQHRHGRARHARPPRPRMTRPLPARRTPRAARTVHEAWKARVVGNVEGVKIKVGRSLVCKIFACFQIE